MADIHAMWEFGKEKKVEKKAKLYKLNVVEGGKDANKWLHYTYEPKRRSFSAF